MNRVKCVLNVVCTFQCDTEVGTQQGLYRTRLVHLTSEGFHVWYVVSMYPGCDLVSGPKHDILCILVVS